MKKIFEVVGEKGYYYELIYGKICIFYLSNFIYINDYGGLLDEVDIWVNKLDIFKEFIKVKILKQILGLNK